MMTSFACEPDAGAALTEHLHAHVRGQVVDRRHQIEGEIAEVEVAAKRDRGRPAKGEAAPAPTSEYRARVAIAEDDDVTRRDHRPGELLGARAHWQRAQHSEGVVGHLQGAERCRGELPICERPFRARRLLGEDAPSSASARVRALAVAADVERSVWEQRVRLSLVTSGERPLVDVTGVKKPRPTAMACVHVLWGIKIMRAWRGDDRSPWQLVSALKTKQQRVMRFSQTPLLLGRTASGANQSSLPSGWEISATGPSPRSLSH